ncbi:MAG: hypothetical protein IAE80_27655 [Anaerolinea sp.]|nr:hypothetical protein [Anaerolinea sp.]
MLKRYLLSVTKATAVLLTLILAAGCSSTEGGALPFVSAPTATPLPFALFSAQDVFDVFSRAELGVQNIAEQNLPAREDPSSFGERFVFEIQAIAPLGGQIVVFDTPDQLAAWQAYIERLRNSSATRRNVVYVYFRNNLMLQLNNTLTTAQATAFRLAFEEMTFTP